ncbi:exported hypothetical protein [Xanthomonas citri pv. citri]|nr:exported hypothetical protein [Xanthomonas citri pv. citri]
MLMMKSSRSRVASSSLQNASTLGGMAQVQPEYLQAMTPLREVRLLRIARGRIARKARGDNQLRTGAQQLQPRLVPDLDAPAGQQGDAPAQVCGFGALEEIQLRTGRAHLVVEMMQLGEFLLAHIAVAQLGRVRGLRRGSGVFAVVGIVQAGGMRREIVRRAEHRFASQCADTALFQQGFGLAHFFLVTLALALLEQLPPRLRLGVIDLGDHLMQPHAVGFGQGVQHAAVGVDGLQHVQGRAQAVGQGQLVVGHGWGVGVQGRSGMGDWRRRQGWPAASRRRR